MYAHAQTPVRIGIAGGGTDLPAWTKTRTGLCLSLAIKMHTHAVVISRHDGQVVASYRSLDEASSATEIANGLIRESALMHGFETGFEVHTLSEVTSQGSGLGVSSSIAVSLAAAFSRLAHMRKGDKSAVNITAAGAAPAYWDGGEPLFRSEAARSAWTIEIERLHRPIGRQDHMAATYGGLRLYECGATDARIVRTFTADDAEWVASQLMLLRLPDGHDARIILSHATDLEALEVAYAAVEVCVRGIETRSTALLGRAISMGHWSKQRIQGAVTPEISRIVNAVNKLLGVFGCKVTGAGGGGHLVVVRDAATTEGRRSAEELDAEIAAVAQLPMMSVEPDLHGLRSEGWL